MQLLQYNYGNGKEVGCIGAFVPFSREIRLRSLGGMATDAAVSLLQHSPSLAPVEQESVHICVCEQSFFHKQESSVFMVWLG